MIIWELHVAIKNQKNTLSTQPNYSFYYLFIKLVIEDLQFF